MRIRLNREKMLGLICASGTLLVLLLYVAGFAPLSKSELYIQDLLLRSGPNQPADPSLVLLAIDKPTYSEDLFPSDIKSSPELAALAGNFPWSRIVWAALVEKFAIAGAKAVVLDLSFVAAGDGDSTLRDVLEKYKTQVVIGANLVNTNALDWPNKSIIPLKTDGSTYRDDRVGLVNIWPDIDSVFRRARFKLSNQSIGTQLLPEGEVLESLAARTLQKIGRGNSIPSGEAEVRFRYASTYEVHSLLDVFLAANWEHRYGNGSYFKDRVVIIGPTANILHDLHLTPYGMVPGPVIHMSIISAVMRNNILHETPISTDLALIVIGGLLAWLLNFFIEQPWRRVFFLILGGTAYLMFAKVLFDGAGIIMAVVTPVFTLGLNGISALTFDFVRERVERWRTRKTLERYVSKNIVKEILDNPQTYFETLGGVRKPVTVLFSDLRNFTTLTEGSDESRLVAQLNEYFSEMVKHVMDNHGTLDKFIGDAVMAVWGNIVSESPAIECERAVVTALKMRAGLVQLNERWQAKGWPTLTLGIGINQGEAIVGNLGSTEKMELTVIGDTVNLASRLEGLTKEFKLDLLVGESVASLVKDKFVLRTVDRVQVKGKTVGVEVFAVSSQKDNPGDPLPAWLAAYEKGIYLYRYRSFEKAIHSFEESLRLKPEDELTLMYLERTRKLLESPPDEEWDTVTQVKTVTTMVTHRPLNSPKNH